jgi:16S rRNA (guanine966-N2)-methyltransferase
MRIVGGTLRGRKLSTPKGAAIRPTSDRVREAVFNILLHGTPDFDINGARVIDLFAGTGALGLEALSRGAAFCLFVDDGVDARGLIRDNAEMLGLTGQTRIFRRDASSLGASSAGRFGLAFLDPPYGNGLAEKALAELSRGQWLEPGAVLVVEEGAGVFTDAPEDFVRLDRRSYGDTEVTFLRFESPEAAS